LGDAEAVVKKPLYQYIAECLIARENCRESGNVEWFGRWQARLEQLDKRLPSGSGFDNGSVIVKAESDSHKIIIETSFHHMDENGSYDGWTEHRLIIKPNLAFGFRLIVGGRDRNDIKSYIAEAFDSALREEIDPKEMEKVA
jgi:hypothetical protein